MLPVLAAAGGILLAGLLPVLPPLWAPILLLLLLVPLALLARRGSWLWTPLAFAAGLVWGTAAGYLMLRGQLPPAMAGQDLAVSGHIVGLPQSRERGQVFLLQPAGEGAEGLPGLLRLSWYTPLSPSAGDHCSLIVRLRVPRGLSNPGGFDYHTWLFSQGIGATGYVRDDPRNTCIAAPAALSVGRWRQQLGDFLTRRSPELDHAGILRALAIGDRQGISREEWRVLQSTGTQHLMAISGLHIGLVAALGYLIGAVLGRGLLPFWPLTGVVPFTAVAVSLGMAAVYAALAGFALPTRRALLMVALVHLCLLRRRSVPIFHVLALALLLVLLASPLAAHSAGFWLSFGAVAALLLGFCGRLTAAGRGRRYLQQALWSQWVVLVGLLVPLSSFNMPAAPLAPLANSLAIPLVSWLVVPPLLLACLLSDLAPGLSHWALWCADTAFAGLWRYLLWVDALAPRPPPVSGSGVVLALALAGGLILLGPRHLPGRWLGLCCLVPLFFPDTGNRADLRITVLDVGQGLAVVVATPGHTLVYDAGPSYGGGFDAGRDIVAPSLRQRRIGFIDRLIISHDDTDHSGGARELMAAVTTSRLLTGEPGTVPEVGPEPCTPGLRWQWDGVQFELLAPAGPWRDRQTQGGGNDRSCVLLITYGEHRILLPGDISAKAEAALLARRTLEGPLTLLLAPHHGSITSSSPRWIDALRPAFVVFSAGYRNRYGHPHPRVVRRYRNSGAVLLNTAEAGAVDFIWRGGTRLEVVKYRQRQRRYWFDTFP